MHAHLDHSSRIPLLIQNRGIKDKICSTQATQELALALFKERNGFDLIERKWFWPRSQREKARCANNGKVIVHWAGSCKKI
jgi:metallo-beta-lactamase family protein